MVSTAMTIEATISPTARRHPGDVAGSLSPLPFQPAQERVERVPVHLAPCHAELCQEALAVARARSAASAAQADPLYSAHVTGRACARDPLAHGADRERGHPRSARPRRPRRARPGRGGPRHRRRDALGARRARPGRRGGGCDGQPSRLRLPGQPVAGLPLAEQPRAALGHRPGDDSATTS